MTVLPSSSNRASSNRSLHWGYYAVGVLAVVGLFTRLTGRTVALAQVAESLAATEAARPTAPPALATPAAGVIVTPGGPPVTAPAVSITQGPTQPLPTPTATLIPGCELYNPADDLLIRVDRDTALPREYEPDDLAAVPLSPKNAYYGSLLLRRLVHQPLLALLEAMNQADLQPVVVSGYRSYSEQTLAYEKWLERYPDRADNFSAVPGHSEHQLGTAVDISTPYMEELFGEQFHPQFFYTKEGQWLSQNAIQYGFILSYPTWAVEQTGYEWEPWHYRYVGVELAQDLIERNVTVSGFIAQCSAAG